ncbi:substrate-binding domain-containing protein [Mycolicibacterium thermoresistibile]
MGRHRLPDPDDEPTGDDSATERFRFPFSGRPEERPGDRGGRHFSPDDFEPDFPPDSPGYGDAPGDGGYADTGYGGAEPGYGGEVSPGRGFRDWEADQPDFGEYGDEPAYGDDSYGDDSYGDDAFGDDSYGEDSSDEEPAETPTAGRRRVFDPDTGEWTGSHRAVDSRPRGVSPGVIAALVGVVILVAGFIGWQFFGDALSNRSGAAAARCVAGDLNISVLADPSISDHTRTLADRYNDTASQVGDKCVKVSVRSAEPDAVIDGLGSQWPADLGDRPAVWIPASSLSAARLEAAAGPQTIDDSRSLVTSPVLLAVRPELKSALGQRDWSALPDLQRNPTALDDLGLTGWGSLKLALPRSGGADASGLVAESVAAASAPDGAPATGGLGAVNALLAGQPELSDDTWSTAFDALVDSGDPRSAPVHAVASTEQQLYQRSTSLSDPAQTVAAFRPDGPTAVADYPTVLLSGDWLEQDQRAAASEFVRFLRRPEQLGELAAAGFRTDAAGPPDSAVVDFAAVSTPLSLEDDEIRVTLAEAVTSPQAGAAVTIMLDRSMTEVEGSNTRMGNAVNALIDRVPALPPSAAVGLWTFDGVAGRSEMTVGPLSEPVDGRPRADALTSVLDAQSSTAGGTVSFTTLRLVYTDATANYQDGQPNSVLVITGGPHTDRTLDGPGLQQFLRQTFDPQRPIAVNIIDFGEDSDVPTWQAVAEATGGTYVNLPTSDTPELAATITRLFG